MVRGIRRVIYIVTASLVLAGCGGGDSGGATTVEGVRVVSVFDVHETEYALSPTAIRIERFGYYGIKAINDGTEPHALEVAGHGVEEETGLVDPGESHTLLVFFSEAGVYELYCPVDGHRQRGMKGTAKVH
jgi:plastocyanin